MTLKKPLGIKNYGSIPHLCGSRIGPGDHHLHIGQERICCEKARDKHDRIIVTEKLDGSNCGVARIGNEVVSLGRSGFRAETSPYRQHQMFADWVKGNESRFFSVLSDGQRIVGEWMAQAHSTRYVLPHEPFVVFDVMTGTKRMPWDEMTRLLSLQGFVMPNILSDGKPLSITDSIERLTPRFHGAIDPIEGAVWRVERRGEFDFMGKYVRHDKVDGVFLPEISGKPEVWNWQPQV